MGRHGTPHKKKLMHVILSDRQFDDRIIGEGSNHIEFKKAGRILRKTIRSISPHRSHNEDVQPSPRGPSAIQPGQ